MSHYQFLPDVWSQVLQVLPFILKLYIQTLDLVYLKTINILYISLITGHKRKKYYVLVKIIEYFNLQLMHIFIESRAEWLWGTGSFTFQRCSHFTSRPYRNVPFRIIVLCRQEAEFKILLCTHERIQTPLIMDIEKNKNNPFPQHI